MQPPKDYFKPCDSKTPGAQRVGAHWFCFNDNRTLSLMLRDGALMPATHFVEAGTAQPGRTEVIL